VPDSTKFRNDLKVMLERVERTVTVTLPVAADTRLADSQIARFQKEWNGKQIGLGVGVATAGARAQIGVLTRPRFVPLIVRVQKASIVKAQALLAAFSGARVANDLIQNLSERLQNLDRALPKAAVVTTSIANISSVVLNALGGILTVGGGVVQLLGLLAAGPGILTGMAVGGLAFGLALVDVKEQLGVLTPGFQNLQNVVSRNFWTVARKPIIDFVRNTLPEFTAGLGATSSAVGSWATSVVDSIGAAFGGGRITTMFAPLIESIGIASTGTTGFATAVAVLGQVGGTYLPRLAQWAADLSNRFGAFLTQVEASGALQQFIENGIKAGHELWDVLYAAGSILNGIATAAGSGGGFGPLADGLGRIAEIVNAEPFQSTLTMIFAGAAAGAAGLATALGPIGAMLAVLAPGIQAVLGASGSVSGSLIGQIAAVLGSPAVAIGLQQFFNGLLGGLAALGPALPAIGSAFGSLLGFAGELASQLGPVLSTVLQALAPILVTILSALKPILPILGTALISIVTQLAPLIMQLLDALLPFVAVLAAQLGPILEQLITNFIGVLGPVTQLALILLDALLPALDPILTLTALSTEMSGELGGALTELMPLFTALAAIVKLAFTIIGAVVSTVVALMKGDFESIGKTWEKVWTAISDFGKIVFNGIMGNLEGFINGAIDIINGLTGGLRAFFSALETATSGAVTIRLGTIPHVALPRLAVGADILPRVGGTAAILAEGGQVESVVNRGRTNRLIELASALANRAIESGSGSGGDTITIHEAVSADATAKEVQRRKNRRKP